MRKIIFRGKRIDNAKWIEGYYTELPVGSLAATIVSSDEELVCEDTASYIIKVFARQHRNYSNDYPLEVIECGKYEVISETVSQYTGLTDKNDKRIFEGDIILVDHPYNGESTHEVIWDEYCWNLKGFCAGCFDYPSEAFSEGTKYMSVIGNISDNPDLLNK